LEIWQSGNLAIWQLGNPGFQVAQSPNCPVASSYRLRLGLTAIGLASLLGYVSVMVRITGRPVFLRWGFPQVDFLGIYLLHFFPLLLLALVAAWWVFRAGADDSATLGIILGFALLFRLLLLPAQPVLSSDIFRYIWDARVQAAGINPYLSRPADFDSQEVKKDPLHQQQNRPFARTIYPPLAQAAFRAVRTVAGESVTAMKAFMLLGDLATLGILVHLLGALGLPRGRVILYAWQPLSVFEIAGSGHVDALAVPFILLAVLAWRRHRDAAAGIALGAATLVKIFPVVLLPAFLGRRRWSPLLACAATIALAYIPFLPGAGLKALGHLPQFLSDPGEIFNPSLMGLASLVFGRISPAPVSWAFWIGGTAMAATLLWLLRTEANALDDLLARIWVVATALTLLTPTLHPWYLLWLLPLLTIQPRPAWIYLTGAISLSYIFYIVTPTTRLLIGAMEYLPFVLLLVWQWRCPTTRALPAAPLGFARKLP
jgi:hypothetical protein